MIGMKRKYSSPSSSSKDAEENFLTCSICFQKFTTNGDCTPRMLTGCGHTFCFKCLNGLFQRQSRVECPSCRVDTKLRRGGGGTESLPLNFQVIQFVKSKEATKPSPEEILQNACVCSNMGGCNDLNLPCMNCEGDEPQVATWGCVDCLVVLCNDCNVVHLKSRMFRNHTSVSTEEYARLSSSRCSKHPSYTIEYTCSECGVMACDIGLSLYHLGHSVLSVKEGSDHERVKAKRLAEDMQKQVKFMESQLARVAKKATNSCQSIIELHDKVERKGGHLVAILYEKMAAAHAQIDELGEKSSRQLEAEKQSLESRLAQARNCLEAADLVPKEASAVAVCALSQKARVAMGSFMDELPPALEPRTSDTGAPARSVRYCAALETQLSIDDTVANRAMGLLDKLFSVEELSLFGQTYTHPLRRQDGGIVGSAENLHSPTGLALRCTSPESVVPSLLFVADFTQHCVQVFDAYSNTFLRSIGNTSGNVATELKGPRHVLLRLVSLGVWLLYVSDDETNRIQVYDADSGVYVRTLGEGELGGPQDMALLTPPEGSGQPALLYVACSDDITVKVLNADSGEVVRTIGSSEAGPGQLHQPEGLALCMAPPGSGIQSVLYVSDLGNHRIQVFDADTGEYVRTIGDGYGKHLGQLDTPSGIALHESPLGSGEPSLLYVADYFNNRVQVFDAHSGAPVRAFGGGRGEGNVLNSPDCVALYPGIDGAMLLFVSETSRVQMVVL